MYTEICFAQDLQSEAITAQVQIVFLSGLALTKCAFLSTSISTGVILLDPWDACPLHRASDAFLRVKWINIKIVRMLVYVGAWYAT